MQVSSGDVERLCEGGLFLDGMSDHDGRRAQECGPRGRQARRSARSLQVCDLKATVTPFSFSSACACTPNGQMLALVYLSWLVMWEPGGR